MKSLGPWTRGDLLLAAGGVVALAASADAAWSVRARFAVDLEGLSLLERAGSALWDLRPLPTAVFLVGAAGVYLGLGESPGLLAPFRDRMQAGVAFLAAAHAALGAAVLAAALWVALAGRLGGEDGLGFVYSPGERITTAVTQAVAWLPLAALLVALAIRTAGDFSAATDRPVEIPGQDEPSLAAEMEALWEERLAFGPRRERARALLARIQALETAGDHEGARRLAAEMRRL